MKANRKFVEGNEEGVSAVIGVILMVAITVAIAATVYVYVSGMIGGTSESTPTITFTPDNSADKLTVVSADTGLNWTDFKISFDTTLDANITGHTAGADFIFTADTTSTIGSDTCWGTVGTGAWANYDIDAGDSITISTSGLGTVKMTLIYAPSNSMVGTWSVSV